MSERTPEHMTDEQALDEYLKGGSSVSQRYRESGADVVPAHLDERVLALARAAPTRQAKSRPWVRWTAPLAVAASAILALSIVLDQGAREHAAVSRAEPPASAAPEVRAESPTRTAPQSPAQERSDALLETPVAPVRPATKAEAPPVAAAREVAPAFAPPEAERSDGEAAQARELKRQVEREGTSARRSEEIAASTPAPRAVEETVASRRPRSIEGAASQEAISSVVATDAAQIEAAAPAANALHDDPDRWLTQIRKLREQGQNEEADEEWKRFREAYPDYPVADSDAAKKKE